MKDFQDMTADEIQNFPGPWWCTTATWWRDGRKLRSDLESPTLELLKIKVRRFAGKEPTAKFDAAKERINVLTLETVSSIF